ncbi:MAG TPA: glycoside hydrolase family 20 zincin-like fold domain-containing protein, partial [Fimbriimonadaceae bacterium]|nr:glycoside hydrolase family 20 zincin-like fold domain-containing protein [Fimbriimonadaceae bacterium]
MLIGLALSVQVLGLSFDVSSGTGLTVSLHEVPIVQGSWFQYYERGWTRGYYSQHHNTQQIVRKPDGSRVLTFRSDDGRAHGSQVYEPTARGLKVRYAFHWDGERPVMLEMTPGMLWAPALDRGRLTINGKPARALEARDYRTNDLGIRSYGAGELLRFESPLADIQFTGEGQDWTIFDARGYEQPWAESRSLIWLGKLAVEVSREHPAVFEVEWQIAPKRTPTSDVRSETLRASPLRNALHPVDERLPLLPKPKEAALDYERPLILTSRKSDPLRYGIIFETTLGNLWDTSSLDGPAQVRSSFGNFGMPREGYEITIDQKGAHVRGQDALGVRHGLRTLATMAFLRDGKLALPTGKVRDWPSTTWRGVHLFVGPTIYQFHQKLWERVLLPMKFNKVVLQMERATWRAIAGTETPITTNRDELVRLTTYYRLNMVEVIPLLQSFGHMEWLFQNGRHLDLAINREVPYAVDPRLRETRTLLETLWDEVNYIIKPATIHFGLDEVDMKGFPSDNPELVTSLWEMHLPFLGGIAEKHTLKPMLWGDMALAPGEAVDAAHGHSKEHAERRRKAIPTGSIIADWHYKADPNPEPFRQSLQIWKAGGFQPVASMWYRPENVRGFSLAALLEGAGTLQTTWAGYESSEANMIRELRQFWVMIVAGDYSWSGRQDELATLGYDAPALFRRMYFDPPAPLTPREGYSLVYGTPLTEVSLAGVRFRLFRPLVLESLVLGQGSAAIDLTANLRARELVFAFDCQAAAEDGQEVATVHVALSDGTK